MSTVIENNTILLSQVDLLNEMPASGVSIIVNDQGTIKQYQYSNIATELSALRTTIGSDKTDTTPSTGLYLQVEKVNTDINELNSIINGTEDSEGLADTISQLQEDLDIQKNKKILEGYNAQFIESSDNINLLSINSNYDFSFPLSDLTLSNYIRSGSGYEVNLHLNLQYEEKNIEYYLYNTAIINLNVGDSSNSSKIIALHLPVINTSILLEITIVGNNLRISVKDCLSTTNIKENSKIYIEYGSLEIKKVAFVDSNQDNPETDDEDIQNPNIVNIPLTLCFDFRDALNSNDNSQVLTNSNMLLGSKIKFDHTDIQAGASMTVKYSGRENVYELDLANVNSQVRYIGNNISSRGNVLTLNESGDLLPAPQVVYFNSDQSAAFGMSAGTWFKYWPGYGLITNLTFNNYNYNGGINHQIKYEITENDQRVNINDVNYVRIDNFCIPNTQWQAFFADNSSYNFNLICKNIANQEVKLTNCVIENSSVTVKSGNNIIILALNYQNEESVESSIAGIKPGIYLHADMKNFTITFEKKES